MVHTVYPNATFGEGSSPTANILSPVSSQQPQPSTLGNNFNPVTGPNPIGGGPTSDPNNIKKETATGAPPTQPLSPPNGVKEQGGFIPPIAP
ncbi:MAG: hypothetical protein K2X66_06175 [Cyanobacteria bacterium]|nr:hypothetical protein [Cyanobacteriota bacterium]